MNLTQEAQKELIQLNKEYQELENRTTQIYAQGYKHEASSLRQKGTKVYDKLQK